MQGSTTNPELECRIPKIYRKLEGDETPGTIVGIALIEAPLSSPRTLGEWKFVDEQRLWIEAFASGKYMNRTVHKFTWVCKFEQPIIIMNSHCKPQGGFMTLSDQDQLQVLSVMMEKIIKEKGAVRIDGIQAIDMCGKTPSTHMVDKISVMMNDMNFVNPNDEGSWEPVYPARKELFAFIGDTPSYCFVLRHKKKHMKKKIKKYMKRHPCEGRMTASAMMMKITTELKYTSQVLMEMNGIIPPSTPSNLLMIGTPYHSYVENYNMWNKNMIIYEGKVQDVGVNTSPISDRVYDPEVVEYLKQRTPPLQAPSQPRPKRQPSESRQVIKYLTSQEKPKGGNEKEREEGTKEEEDSDTDSDEWEGIERIPGDNMKVKPMIQRSVKVPVKDSVKDVVKVHRLMEKSQKCKTKTGNEEKNKTEDIPERIASKGLQITENRQKQVMKNQKEVGNEFPHINFSPETTEFYKGISRKRIGTQLGEKKVDEMNEDSIIKHLRFLKALDGVVEEFPLYQVFINDSKNLHFPLFCQSIFLAWRTKVPKISIMVVSEENHLKAMQLLGTDCGCLEHATDTSRSNYGAMTSILKFAESNVQKMLNIYARSGGGAIKPCPVSQSPCNGCVLGPVYVAPVDEQQVIVKSSHGDNVVESSHEGNLVGSPQEEKSGITGEELTPIKELHNKKRKLAVEARKEAQRIFALYVSKIQEADQADLEAAELAVQMNM